MFFGLVSPNHFRKSRSGQTQTRKSKRRSRPHLESLESRTVLYSTTGNLWANPGLITISIMPDGTNLGVSGPADMERSKPRRLVVTPEHHSHRRIEPHGGRGV